MTHVENLWSSATAVADTDSITSKALDMANNKGFMAILVKLAGGGTNEVNVTLTVGKNDIDTFYSPVDTVGTSLGTIYSALTSTKYIQFDPVVSRWMKITITGTSNNGSNTTAEAYLMWQEEIFP